MMRIRIRRLVIEGVDPYDGSAVSAAFQAELARLLAGEPAPARRPTAGPADEIGRRIAASVHARLVDR